MSTKKASKKVIQFPPATNPEHQKERTIRLRQIDDMQLRLNKLRAIGDLFRIAGDSDQEIDGETIRMLGVVIYDLADTKGAI